MAKDPTGHSLSTDLQGEGGGCGAKCLNTQQGNCLHNDADCFDRGGRPTRYRGTTYNPPVLNGPMCTANVTCRVPDRKNSASYYSSANSYYWSLAYYSENAIYAFSRLSLGKDGNLGLSGGGTWGLFGRHCTTATVNSAITKSFTGWSSLGFSFATSFLGNYIDYEFGANSDKGAWSQEFYVSTAVDTAIGYTIGAAAVLAVGAVVATPAVLVVGTLLFATAATAVLNHYGVPDLIKQKTNDIIDDLQG